MAKSNTTTSTTTNSMAEPAPVIMNSQVSSIEGSGLSSGGNIPATKQFVFNETGNIFVATTIDGNTTPGQESGTVSANALQAFEEVSVFFAAMTKSIGSTINPATQKNYSLYDYSALNKVIENSGLFALITQEEIQYESSSWGASLSMEFVKALIGFAAPSSLISAFSSLIRSMGKEAISMGGQKSNSESKVGTVIFVCEYLLGAVSITTLLVYADVNENSQAFQIGPCFQEHSENITWHLNKDTYLFIPPSFIKQANSMNEAMANPDFLTLVNTLKGTLNPTPAKSTATATSNSTGTANAPS